MLLTEKEARTICEKLLSYVKADDAIVGVGNQSLMELLASGNIDMIGKPERVGSSEGQGAALPCSLR